MRVGFVTSSYPDDRRDPRGVFVHRLARSLVGDGIDVTVVAPGSDDAPARDARDGVSIRRMRYWPAGGQRITRDLAGIEPAIRGSPWLAIQVPPLIARLCQGAAQLAGSCEIIHAHWLYPAGLAAVASRFAHRLPVIITSHGGDLNLARRSTPLMWLSRFVARRADYCIGVNPRDSEMLRRFVPDRDAVEFMPVGVDDIGPDRATRLIRPQDDPQLFEFAEQDGLKALYVGSLVTRKSIRTLLEAVGQLQSDGVAITCAIVGDGPDKAGLQECKSALGLNNVWFAGTRPPEEIPHWLLTADLLVLPSRQEPWGSVVAEAMAAGTPAVVSETAGSALLIENGHSGYTFPEGSVSALRERLRSYAELPADSRQRMTAAAYDSVRDTGILTAQIARRHYSIYRSIIACRR